MASPKPEIAFIGLGAMGFGMATHLVSESYPVTGFDVWGPTLERFAAAGGKTATTPAAAVAGKAFCVVMVATAQQAQAVLLTGPDPAAPALVPGATLLLCSTVPCGYVQKLAAELRPDVRLVDCPVSGGAARAADGTLSIMAGGSEAALEAAGFLLAEMSDAAKLYIVPGGVGAGSNMKMVHQVLAACQILSASEALGFAANLGLDPAEAAEAVLGSGPGGGGSFMFSNRLPRILDPEGKTVASAVTIILKDAGIINAEARRAGFATPMTAAAEQVYLDALGRGWGAADDGSLVRLYTAGKDKLGPLIAAAAEYESVESRTALVVALLKGIHLCAAAEALAFASKVRLDLAQVFEVCVNAAGGSAMLDTVGPDIMKLLSGQQPGEDKEGLTALAESLAAAVSEAQRVKMPLFLGNQALNLMRLAMAHAPKELKNPPRAAVVKVWAS